MENTPATTVFDILIWTGAFVSFIGLCGLVWCIIFIARARKAKLSDEDMRARLRKAVPLNMGSLFLSVIGLMLVVIGIFMS